MKINQTPTTNNPIPTTFNQPHQHYYYYPNYDLPNTPYTQFNFTIKSPYFKPNPYASEFTNSPNTISFSIYSTNPIIPQLLIISLFPTNILQTKYNLPNNYLSNYTTPNPTFPEPSEIFDFENPPFNNILNTYNITQSELNQIYNQLNKLNLLTYINISSDDSFPPPINFNLTITF